MRPVALLFITFCPLCWQTLGVRGWSHHKTGCNSPRRKVEATLLKYVQIHQELDLHHKCTGRSPLYLGISGTRESYQCEEKSVVLQSWSKSLQVKISENQKVKKLWSESSSFNILIIRKKWAANLHICERTWLTFWRTRRESTKTTNTKCLKKKAISIYWQSHTCINIKYISLKLSLNISSHFCF